jgi:hypothetical protein
MFYTWFGGTTNLIRLLYFETINNTTIIISSIMESSNEKSFSFNICDDFDSCQCPS